MDSRFRGNDGGEAGIRRQESDSGGRRKCRRERGDLSGENVGGAEIESATAVEKIKMAGAVCVIICGL